MIWCTYGAVTDKGDIRQENQDSILIRSEIVCGEPIALFLVADGMGGLDWGAKVSRYIAQSFDYWWETELRAILENGYDTPDTIKELLEQVIWDINQEILRFREENGSRCGSTLSVLLVCRGQYFIENMGDSRIYLLRDRLQQLTQDQSLAAKLVREGRLSENEVENFPKKNVLTMCLGMFAVPESFFVYGKLKEGDRFLLCSDGLHGRVEESQMQEILEQKELNPQTKAEYLRNMIQPGKASDNVSVIIVEAEGDT